ncbi:hypothetical protein SAY87_005168 [Trapa incisa]|uniref:Uncharacterized protein n=1 Tax=Trapa incisa TaxID=236973 RepID=A0AAN7K494_9MYRT|nr:hypothetical protein SAY87_005168 [Trapa incisa]
METGHTTSNALSTFSAQVNTAASSSRTSSVDLSYDLESPENGHASHSSSPRSSPLSIQRTVMQSADSSYPSLANTQREEESNNETLVQDQEGVDETMETEHNADDPPPICAPSDDSYDESHDKENEDNGLDHDNKVVSSLIEDNHPQQNEKANDMEGTILASTAKEQDTAERDVSSFCEANHGTRESAPSSNRSKNVMSVRSTSDSVQCGGMERSPEESKEVDAGQEVKNGVRSFRTNDRKDVKVYPKDTRSTLLEAKVQQLEHRIQVLENELREVAAVEVSLYSVVAEHGNSMAKVHAPARRLSRMYLHACQHYSLMRRASAARNIISGLVSVSKACGNDVPRLTYWLSNSIVLRAVISKKVENMEFPSSPVISKERSNAIKGSIKLSPLKWESSPIKKGSDSSDFERPQFLISALEKVEAWIFSRTIESIWWQTLTPYMQSARRKEIDRSMSGSSKNYMEETNMDIQDQGNISMNLWKEAFKDACERLCPVRVAGHECGCLPMLPKLIMEQCVARLDVAMFNALLRESADEIPTDPISDPICDSKVLPIPAGRSSFGAGAQLKNAIGNWSRWLTDLFGMDDDSLEDEERADIDDERQDNSLKSFYLLNALSDLMMLPKDMLLSKSIRKEVCPTFGASLIKRVLNNFVPDEFCPDPIPKVVFEALDYEDPVEAETDSVTAYPYIATPPSYMSPSPASIEEFIGDTGSSAHLRRSGSSVLRKSYTSDDELDELNSPMASILPDGSRSSPVNLKSSWSNGNHQNVLRFDLLREVWSNSE